jgi:lipopolysaccharide export LptBFGC system permease protein LptF
MTLSELRREIARSSADGEARGARQLAFAFHFRFALAAATRALASLLLAARANHRGARGLLALTACFVYWGLMLFGEFGSRRGYLPQPVGAWLPNLILIGSAVLIASARSSRLRGPLGSAP